MITSDIPSPSGFTQTTAASHNIFSSFLNQSSSHYPIPTNLLPYDPFPPYSLPVQQPVLPPSYPQAYRFSYPYMLQQENDPTLAHAPSDFSFSFPPNPVHLNQQYSVLPSHNNTPIPQQSPSFIYEPHTPSHLTDGPPPRRPRLNSPHLTSFTPTSTAVAHHSLAPPTPATTILSAHTTATSQVTLSTSPSLTSASEVCSPTFHSPLSHNPTPSYTPSPLTTTAISTSVTAVVHSPTPPSTSATTPSSGTASSYQHSLCPNMQQYVTYLSNLYNQKKTPVYDKEARLLHFKCKSFINVALVHKNSKVSTDSEKKEMLMNRLHGYVDVIQKKKTKLRMCDVCKNQDGTLAHSVLVEGAPGVGKTTFAFQLCKQWARGEILHEWTVVVIIKLRDKTIRNAQVTYDLLYYPDPEVRQAVVKELVQQDGKGMLLILDGYDELTDSQIEDNSIVQQLLNRQLLCCATLMVTSRPLATRTLHDNFVQSIDQHIEVLGFTEKNIEEYIQSAYGDKPELVEDFKSYLSSHPFSSALMFNPLECAIVTDLYRSHWELGDKGFAPNTMTELYTGLVHIILLRHLTHHPEPRYRIWRIIDLNDLPETIEQQFNAVTKLAAQGIENQQYVFDDNIPSETLGLMQKEEDLTAGSGLSVSCNFLHLTLQEYLAAVNYSQQCSSPEQLSQVLTQDDLFPLMISFFENYGKKRKRTSSSLATHWPVVLFVAGRTKLDGISPNILMVGVGHNVLEGEKRQVHWQRRSHYCLTDYSEVNVSLLHLLYETQSPQLIQSTLVTSRKYLSVSGSSALDWFVIGYCIANSTSTWRVEKKGNDSPKYFDQLIMGLSLGPEECSGECKIGSLHISGHWTGNWKILFNLQPYAKSVTEIKLVANKQREKIGPEKSKRKSVFEEASACFPMLESLTINNVKSSYSASLLSFISQHNNLHILSLNQCNLSSSATSSLIHFLQSPNNRLHELTLEDCTFQIPDHCDSVVISYQRISISPTDTAIFSLTITGSLYAINYILSQPHLFCTNILTILKVAIVSGTGDSLQIETSNFLNLNMLIITSEEENRTLLHDLVVHIISQQKNLHVLSFKRCILTHDTVRLLIRSLQSSNCGLQELTLDDCVSDHTHTTTTPSKLKLKSLDSGNVSLEITGYCCDITHWLSQLSSYTQLTELVLYLEGQDSTTANTLQEIQSHYHVLESLKIDGDEFILPSFISQFIGSQQNNLRTLSLRKCTLGSDVTKSLIYSLQSPNYRLHKLTMDKCTISISDEIQQNTISTKNNTTLCSLVTTDSLCVLNHILSNVIFTKMTELSLCITTNDSSAAEVLAKIPVSCPVLETIKIDSGVSLSLPFSILQFIELQQNNLHNLSLRKCNLSSDVTRSLIHSLQSPLCRLHTLTMYKCTISTPNETKQNTIFTKTMQHCVHWLLLIPCVCSVTSFQMSSSHELQN